jgi:hypothetical protein
MLRLEEPQLPFHSVYLTPKHHFHIKYIRCVSLNPVENLRRKGSLRIILQRLSLIYFQRVHAANVLAVFFSGGDKQLDELLWVI